MCAPPASRCGQILNKIAQYSVQAAGFCNEAVITRWMYFSGCAFLYMLRTNFPVNSRRLIYDEPHCGWPRAQPPGQYHGRLQRCPPYIHIRTTPKGTRLLQKGRRLRIESLTAHLNTNTLSPQELVKLGEAVRDPPDNSGRLTLISARRYLALGYSGHVKSLAEYSILRTVSCRSVIAKVRAAHRHPWQSRVADFPPGTSKTVLTLTLRSEYCHVYCHVRPVL
jgi:hypothetical protein